MKPFKCDLTIVLATLVDRCSRESFSLYDIIYIKVKDYFFNFFILSDSGTNFAIQDKASHGHFLTPVLQYLQLTFLIDSPV